MKIFFAIHSLSRGGTERITLHLAEGFYERGHDITILLAKEHDGVQYPVPQGIKCISLDGPEESNTLWQAISFNLQRLKLLKRILIKHNPDIVIAMGTETAILTLMVKITSRIIVSERYNPHVHKIKYIWALLRRLLYTRSSCVVFPSEGVCVCYPWIPENKRHIIYNPIKSDWFDVSYEKVPFYVEGRKYIISIGRMDHNKGFDRLISCFQQIAQQFHNWDLVICGDGHERDSLFSQIKAAGLEGRVHLPGQITNIRTALAQADIFAFTSRSEGFPNVLLEAMAVGLPPVVFDIDFGPREIITAPEQGILIADDNRKAFSQALQSLMVNGKMRDTMGKAAQERAKFFIANKILDEWEYLFTTTSKDR